MKKFLILLLSLFLVFSFVSCDNGTPAPGTGTESGGGETGGDTPAVTGPEWLEIPAADKGEMSEEIKTDMMTTVMTFVNKLNGQIDTTQPSSTNTVGVDYSYDGNIIFKYEDLSDGSREYTANIDGEIIKAGDKIVQQRDSFSLNGSPMTEEEKADYESLSDKIYSHREEVTDLFEYEPVDVEGKDYTVTMKRTVSKKMDNTGTANDAITACTYSLNELYGNIKEITIYGEGVFSDSLYGIPTGDVICEIKGNESIKGIYSTTLTIK